MRRVRYDPRRFQCDDRPAAQAGPEAAKSLQHRAAGHLGQGEAWLFESWAKPLALGQPLPTLPLWLADNLAVPLDLEASYEETCRALRIP